MSNTNVYSHPKFAIASLSLGNNVNHDLPTKIRVASSLGYDGIEIFIPDFEAFVDEVKKGQHSELFVSITPSSSSSSSPSFSCSSGPSLTNLSQADLELECAHAISAYCTTYNLEIPIFQPYRNFENFRSQGELDTALDGAERWFRLMSALKCDLMLVCSNHVPGPYPITEAYTFEMYRDAQVEAFRQLGARAAKYNVRVGYEPLSWGTVVDNWMQVWDVVKRVDMDNVGVILDSFNTLGNQYADPGRPSCIRSEQTLFAMVENLVEMSNTIPVDKVFFYQVADAVRPPEICEDDDEMPRRMKWSRACRVFPCEPLPESSSSPSSSQDSNSYDPYSDKSNPPSGYLGFLPVAEMTSLLHHGNGYRGWWSLEVFNKSLQESDEGCPWRHGRRGIDGLYKLWEVVQQDVPSVKNVNGIDKSLKEKLGVEDKFAWIDTTVHGGPPYSDDSTPPLSDSEYSSFSLGSEDESEDDEAEVVDVSKVSTVLFAEDKVGAEEV